MLPISIRSLCRSVEGSPYLSHFIFEINVGKRRIRHTTTLQLNDEVLGQLKIDEDDVIQIQSRSMSDLTLSDIDFKNKMALVWTTLFALEHMESYSNLL